MSYKVTIPCLFENLEKPFYDLVKDDVERCLSLLHPQFKALREWSLKIDNLSSTGLFFVFLLDASPTDDEAAKLLGQYIARQCLLYIGSRDAKFYKGDKYFKSSLGDGNLVYVK